MNKEKLYVIKIGGNIIDDEQRLEKFLRNFAGLNGHKILVHGGGKLATRLAVQLNIPQQMVEGRRITDAETLKIVTMVYAGLINKQIVAMLQAHGENAIGLCGADGNLIRSEKRKQGDIDYGFVGDVREVNDTLILSLLRQKMPLVIAPITHDGSGLLLNTNADTMAQEMARSMSDHYAVNLVYSFEKKGVLSDIADEESVIPQMTRATYIKYREEGKIFAGMIPKLDNAFAAIESGVERVIIGMAEELDKLVEGMTGTTLMKQ